jgi:hypothetical protein
MLAGRRSISISSLGTGFLLNAMRLAGARDFNDIGEAADMKYWGTAGIALGIGLLIAAAVSWAMARRWGMLEQER